ncbi:hypothetical protein bcCo53_001519 (plasmid) [Borrelia coriaceae]|uniref:Variable outer membrane protein n=1 Tax=Borrelia coriaceae ATCC 43381 TaxID=1408429 RepID=W5SWW7_9SPIR|nr:Vsp/OspC family lipoprotein [Borrelia coriaceae]AHH11699.1 Variable outer membrane protein [Borrelia coriaceae ATCC 43381]UPA17333.1 hypothetical protein bcCo53_001519 [Borrelia coriaceae]
MKINIKNIMIKSICATLFISLFLSCNNAGPELRDGQAAMADGRVIDLVEVSGKIKEVSTFVVNVKEIETLVKSIIDGISKGIKKKIGQNGLEDDSGAGAHYTPLLAGAYKVAEIIEKKSKELKVTEFFKGLEDKVKAVAHKAEEFVKKLRTSSADLGTASGAATDANAKKAIDINDSGKDKGASELITLNKAIGDLLNAANEVLKGTIKGVKEPARLEVVTK